MAIACSSQQLHLTYISVRVHDLLATWALIIAIRGFKNLAWVLSIFVAKTRCFHAQETVHMSTELESRGVARILEGLFG